MLSLSENCWVACSIWCRMSFRIFLTRIFNNFEKKQHKLIQINIELWNFQKKLAKFYHEMTKITNNTKPFHQRNACKTIKSLSLSSKKCSQPCICWYSKTKNRFSTFFWGCSWIMLLKLLFTNYYLKKFKFNNILYDHDNLPYRPFNNPSSYKSNIF